MEPTLFSFIWKYSKRQQLVLLCFTLVSFPFLYASLELPKRIINDAIGATTRQIPLMGMELTQVQFLLVLCFAFLATVIASGLMKMRINTMKGVLAERLLRRLRYQLISRMMRFPKPYFRTTSQGELVSMVTSEVEPMGGLMGDAVAQPAFQAGQMLTIVAFLFAQSMWFGLASIALIPVQAWLIPILQRQINLLNKDRIVEVRKLASEIGESAAGIEDLRANGGWRYRLAMFTDRLGRLFEIRFRIYQKKFFMKFLNNLITQMTPFLFYSVGGYLAINGQITVGALVAALAAYKDLSSPWKELLFYYNQVQDMSLRWDIITEKFAPKGMIKEHLFEGEPDQVPHLNGAIDLENVTVLDHEGNPVLEDITLSIPPGARVAFKSKHAAERTAFAQLLTREVVPTRGRVTLTGHPLETMHQAVIAARIGYAHSRPYLFDGTLGDNLLMPLRAKPQSVMWDPHHKDRRSDEAKRSGNSPDSLHSDWVDPDIAGLSDGEDIRDWWFKLVEAMGLDETMLQRTMRSQFDPKVHPGLARIIVGLRPEIHEKLLERGLEGHVHRFHPDAFNPTVPLGGNLLYAAPTRPIHEVEQASTQPFIRMLHDHGLAEEGLAIAQEVMEILCQTFGRTGTDHPLFRKLGIEDSTYLRLTDIAEKRMTMDDRDLAEEDLALLLTVPFMLTAEQIGPSFPDRFKAEIVAIRQDKSAQLRAYVGDMFVGIAPDVYIPRLCVMDNALFGRVSSMAGAKAQEIEDVVAEVFTAHGLRQRVASIIYDMPAGLGGSNVATGIQERTGFSRAAIKRPDILIIDKALASQDSKSRLETRRRLRDLLPKTTMIFMEDNFDHPDAYDLYVEMKDGRIDGVERSEPLETGESGASDLSRKLRVIAATEMFGRLDARNQRLLAFSAQWFEAEPGQVIFAQGDVPDAAYLCLDGLAELRWPQVKSVETPISKVEPGRLIGDLAIIVNEARKLDLVSVTKTSFLRIGAEEFRAVIASDASAAMVLLEAVAGHLSNAGELLRRADIDIDDFNDVMAGVEFAQTVGNQHAD